jgi:integral membrane sensor domain MASE1
MGCMRIELGKPTKATGFLVIFNGLYEFIIIWIGGFIGLVSFVPFVLIDLYYIKRKIETKLNQNIIRIVTVLILSAIVTLIHYVLEFVLDWI